MIDPLRKPARFESHSPPTAPPTAPDASPAAAHEAAAFASSRQEGGPRTEGDGLYRLLVETVRDYAIFALDPTGHVISWNAGAELIKGWTAEEILGKHFSTFYPAEDIASRKPDRELEIAKAVGRVEDEGWRLRKDGTRFWANVVITALHDPSGGLVGFAKVTRDLTERRAAENALRESEERFRLIVQSVRDYAIFMLDPHGRVASWNEGAQRFNGYTAEEVIGRHFSIFYPPEDIRAGKPERELQTALRDGSVEDEGWRLRKDGTRFWANVVITPLRDEAAQLVGFAKVTRDLTERRALQERAVDDARRLADSDAANRAKSGFLAAMSHELRTPLNAIGGYADLLTLGLGGDLSPQQRSYLERIRGSQQHLLAIINAILNFSRVEAGQLEYDCQPVSLVSVVDTVLPMIEPQATAKRLMLTSDAPDDVVAIADRPKTEQVLLNLLSNAVKFTPEGGRIHVVARRDGDRVWLIVEDTGVGIPPEHLEAIFEPFIQVGRSLTSPHEGTGLGLAISRDLAHGMGGDLNVESTLGKGSRFMLWLPAASPTTEGTEASRRDPDGTNEQDRKRT